MKKFLLVLFVIGLQAQTPHTVTLTWADTQNPSGTQYNAYRLSGACPVTVTVGSFTKLNTTPVSGFTFVDSTVTVNSAYCYYVTATNGTNESVPSNTTGGTVNPFAPSGLTLGIK